MKFTEMYPKDRIYAADFRGRAWTVTFRRTDPVTSEVLGKGGPSEKVLPVWHFEETTKKMPAVVTNGVCARAMFGDDSDDWAGHKITLYPAQDPSGLSDDGLCIRVKGSPELTGPLTFQAQIGRTKKTFKLVPTGKPGPDREVVDLESGEVTGADTTDDPATSTEPAESAAPTPDESTEPSDAGSGLFEEADPEPPGRGPSNVTPINPDGPATTQQLAEIKKLRKAAGLNAAEFNMLVSEYGGDPTFEGYGLSQEQATYVIEALKERGQ